MGKRVTSGYTLVVHRVDTDTALLWIGALSPAMGKSNNWRLVVRRRPVAHAADDESGRIVERLEYKGGWQSLFSALSKRFYTTKTLTNLQPDTDYIVEFQVRSEKKWRLAEKAFLTTLPVAIPTTPEKPFTVGVSSCFYTEHDGGDAGQAYEALYKDEKLRPNIKFLVGDQVYADIGLGWYPLDESDCQDRIADHYADSWKYLRSILRRGGTWMISDDHEFWNNYPFLQGFNPYLSTLKLNKKFRGRWESAARTGVNTIQQSVPVRSFDIGGDLSFCVADLRLERSDTGFLAPASFKKLLSWVAQLSSPGVLVIPQPLIAKKGGTQDKNLPDWKQYKELLRAIESGKHDIVVLTGDVHYGRVSQVMVGSSSNTLTEIITSPLSNLSEINGFATNKPDLSPRLFPLIPISNFPSNLIDHKAKVTTEKKWYDIRYPKERTHEHFMTVDFYRTQGKLKMRINAWHAREVVKSTGLPKRIKGFKVSTISLS